MENIDWYIRGDSSTTEIISATVNTSGISANPMFISNMSPEDIGVLSEHPIGRIFPENEKIEFDFLKEQAPSKNKQIAKKVNERINNS